MAKAKSFRFSDEENEMLEELSRELGVSQSDIMRLLIRLGFKFVNPDTIEILRGLLKPEADNET